MGGMRGAQLHTLLTVKQSPSACSPGMLSWKITPFDLAAVGHGLTDAFTRKLLRKGLLPEGEYNDGLILAETSLAAIPVLVTADKHLLDLDETFLSLTFDECDLFHVRPCHPKPLLRAMR